VADAISAFLDRDAVHSLGSLALSSRCVVEGNLVGAHRSPRRGTSTEFADHRAYVEGDDPKHIDWKAYGRTERHYVKRYEDETNLRVYLVVDRSASMGYGTAGLTKYRYACALAAAIAYVVVKARDSVGLFVHSDKVDFAVEPGNTFLHLNNLLLRLRDTQPGSTTRLGDALNQIAAATRKRALIAIFSDLLGVPEEIGLAFAHFRRRHHDVMMFHVLDPTEIELPFRNAAKFEDMETGEDIVVDPRSVADSYRKAFGEFMTQCRELCADMGIDYRLARTDGDLNAFVRSWLEDRRRLSR